MTLNYFREDGLLVLDAGRLRLREQSPAAAAVLAEGGTAGLDWLDGSPGSGTQIAAKMVAMATEAGAFLPGWGLYVIERTTDGAALGGIGFHGPPSDGSVEIGYDLTESARGSRLGHGRGGRPRALVARTARCAHGAGHHRPRQPAFAARPDPGRLHPARRPGRAVGVRVDRALS